MKQSLLLLSFTFVVTVLIAQNKTNKYPENYYMDMEQDSDRTMNYGIRHHENGRNIHRRNQQFSLRYENKDSIWIEDSSYNFNWSSEINDWTIDWKYTYLSDENGNRIKRIRHNWNQEVEKWDIASKNEYFYDEDGNWSRLTSYNWGIESNTWVETREDILCYDTAGNWVEWLLYKWNLSNEEWDLYQKYTYSYDTTGLRIERLGYVWDSEQNEWIIYRKELDFYDTSRYLINRTKYSWRSIIEKWDEYSKYDYTYDEDGHMIVKMVSDWNTGIWDEYRKYHYYYDNNGNENEEISYSMNSETNNWVEDYKWINYWNLMVGVNDIPVITGTSTSLTTPEETPLLITVNDLVIVDPDNSFPDDFSLTVLEGENYSVSNNEIKPDIDFNGILSPPVFVNDGIDNSPQFTISIEVSQVNDIPVITGTSTSLTTPEETPLLITVNDLVIDDPDNNFPDDFSLTVLEGENYSVSNNEIKPDIDFNGTLSTPVFVNDSIDNSTQFTISIEVSQVNDIPVITGTSTSLTTPEETPLLITVNDLVIFDPDNSFPDDFSLTVLEGENYSVSNNEIKPDIDFNGTLSTPVLVNDGTDNSTQFTISIEVIQILGISNNVIDDNFSIYPNPINDQLYIHVNNTIRSYQLKIYSLDGVMVYTTDEEIGYRSYSIDLSHLSNRIYLLQIISDNKIGSTKIIKK